MPDETIAPPGRLLIVDDEVRLMTALRDTLRDQNYEVIGVTTGEEALAALRATPFDLLLTDLTMPQMDGITLLKASLEADPNLVGIMMTGQGTIATAVEAMQVGAFDYILKPFKLSAILPVLARALAIRKLRRQNAELHQRVVQRTAELEAANHDLEAANQELEAFSHSVSHDLRMPLRAVIGFAGMVHKECHALLPSRSQEHLRHVVAGAEQMNRLIDDLLRFSRFSRQPLAKQPVKMSALVAEVVADLRAEPGDASAQVKVEELPDCQADPMLLRQVLVNLLSNAFKFTRGKEPRRVDVGWCRGQTGETAYFVRDNGAGFEMKYAGKLFGVFQRMHRTEEFEGTGVGLSIVQRIVKRHGGRVWAEAKVGEGAVFFFTLGSPGTAPAA